MRKQSNSLVGALSVILACYLGIGVSSAQQVINLTGGPVTVNLPPGNPTPTLVFKNLTNSSIHDLLLSTQLSPFIDPDFEGGPITVRKPPNGNNLGWTSTPAPADGVEDIKVKTMFPEDKLVILDQESFSVEMFFLGETPDSGDKLTITPTNIMGKQIASQQGAGLHSRQKYELFHGYEGLTGSLDVAFDSFNNTSGPAQALHFRGVTTDVLIASVESTLPSKFDATTGVLWFTNPVPPGAPIEFSFSVASLPAFDESDPHPFSSVESAKIPAVSEWGLLVMTLITLTAGTILVGQRRLPCA